MSKTYEGLSILITLIVIEDYLKRNLDLINLKNEFM